MPGPRQKLIAVDAKVGLDDNALYRHADIQAMRDLAEESPLEIEESEVEHLDLPFGGALAHEGVANRTRLVGPIGGFYSATGEDVYPCCWSAIHAAEVLKKALKEQFLQDAIQAYRQKWRTTLGDYLRAAAESAIFAAAGL